VFNIKLVELEILKISYLENFSSYYMILGVIWPKQFEIENLGGLQWPVIIADHRATWAPASYRGLWPASSHACDHHLARSRL
jgi:hypothetical protein